ncbi:MAG TPA: acetamidase/formamidase family protein [Puia sp.]
MRSIPIAAILLCYAGLAPAQRSIRFDPTTYSNAFSAAPAPVLRIQQGDTVYTTSVDAGGKDKYGAKVANRGNPLTGPFYIEGAEPGDILAVTLLQVSLNRNFATTMKGLVPKVLPSSISKKNWRFAKSIKWQLDVEKQVATPLDTALRLQHITIPLQPFLGCVGVAPAGEKGTGSGAFGPYGGNLDLRYNTTGATIYLPVFHSGALLYLGDGHAAQGDGELNGDALETSMNFGFTVKVVKKDNFPLQVPMAENNDYLMFIGIESSLDKSLKSATGALLAWLLISYRLSFEQATQIIGPAMEYRIPKIAATKVEVVALIPKRLLEQIKGAGVDPIQPAR